MNLPDLIKRLSETAGISGHEEPIRKVVTQEFGRFADEVQVDKLGSLAALKHGSGKRPRRRILLAAHMDEIGLMVAGVENGFLRVTGVGGVDPRIMLAQEVVVHGKVTPLDKVWVDTGLGDAQARRLVRVGDLISMRRGVTELKNDLLSGKAFDNRVSVAAVVVCLEALTERRHAWDIVAVATVQEEKNLLGAATSAFRHAPDIAIAIDVTFGSQNGSSEADTFPLGKGPTIGIGPNVHPKMWERLIDVGKRLELSTALEPIPGASGTDAWAMQIARGGVPCGIVGIPLRSMHTTVETVAVKDVERTGRLLAAFIAELDESFYTSLTE